MKIVVSILSLTVIFSLVVSQSLGAEWTVMVYCDADNNLDEEGVEDLNELEYAGSTEQVNMIFLLDRCGWDDTRLYYVLNDPSGAANGSDMNIVSEDISASAPWLASEEDMGNPQTLQDFAVWTIRSYPAEHYLLSIWDHGSGIFLAEAGGTTKGECWDDHGGVPGEYIDLAELRGVLAAAYAANGNRKIDIVGHDVCVLGQIETHYQMKDYVEVGIASEEGEPADGWEYGFPFYDLAHDPSMSARTLASKIVDYYCARYGAASYVTQAAMDLTLLDDILIPKLNTFSQMLAYFMHDWQANITKARDHSDYYNWDCGPDPDLYHFAQLISQDTALPDTLRFAAQDLMSCYPGVVFSECHGNWRPNAHGISVWFPDDFLTNACKNDYLTKVEFSQESWDEFLAAYDDPQPGYSGPVWYVSPAGDDLTGDGSPYVPFRTIQKGIERAGSGDTVLVAPGRYRERIDFRGKGILVASHFIFERDPGAANSTIIDADASVLGISDTGSVVVLTSGEDSSAGIQGFTLQNGIGTLDAFGNRHGGGIYCDSCSATIRHNVIRNNSASFGGGIDCYRYSSPQITGNRITGNSASYGGGIWSDWWSSPNIRRNIIAGNTAQDGGGIFCGSDCLAEIKNNVIIANQGTTGGGVLCDGNASPVIVNNIVAGSPNGAGVWCGDEAWPAIAYNDVWNNADGDFCGGRPGVGDTSWADNYNGTACDSFYNIVCDPVFADTVGYALVCGSPCIDAGDPSSEVPAAGGRRIDIGSWEYFYTIGDVNHDGQINLCDLVSIINCVTQAGVCPCPSGEGDVACNGLVDISDVVYLIDYLLKGGPEPGCHKESGYFAEIPERIQIWVNSTDIVKYVMFSDERNTEPIIYKPMIISKEEKP